MIAHMVRHRGLGKAALRVGVAVDCPVGRLMPGNVESCQFRIELELAVRQVVVNPPGQRLPVAGLFEVIDEGRHDDAGGRTHLAIRIPPVPDMTREVRLVAGTAVLLFMAEAVHLAGPVGGSNGETPKLLLQRLE